MKFDESLFSVTPEAFKAVNVHRSFCEAPLMIDSSMFIPKGHQGIIGTIFIGINDRTEPDFFNGQIHQRFSGDIRNDTDRNPSISLEETENGHLSRSTSTTVSFSSAAEIRFIGFNFSGQFGKTSIGFENNRLTNNGITSGNSFIIQICLSSSLACRQFHFKDLNDHKPLRSANPGMMQPGAGKVRKVVFTSSASIATVGQNIRFCTAAKWARFFATLPSAPDQVPMGCFHSRN